MEQLTQEIVQLALGLRGPLAYGLVAFFSWAEAAFFLGLVTPGELAIAVGGMLASRGQLALEGVAAAAAAGTVLGNLTGFLLGRSWGIRVPSWAPGAGYLERSLASAQTYVRRRGEWAVAVGAFVSYVRIFVPFLAGGSGMSVRRFLAYNVPAAVVWAAAWALFGFLLGESWRALRQMAGTAAFLVLVLFLLAVVIRWAAVRVARRGERGRALLRRLVEAGPVSGLRRRLRAQLRWLGRHVEPGVARVLSLGLGFLVLLAGAGAAGIVLNQVENVQGIALIDFPVLEWVAATRTEAAVRVARTGLRPLGVPGLPGTAVVLAAAAWWRWGWKPAARVVVGVLGAGLGAELLDRYVLQPVVPRTEFPAVPVAAAAAVLVHVTAAVGARQPWGRSVGVAAAGVFLTCAVSLAAVVAGWAAPSGVALGFALGLIWSSTVELSTRLP